VVASGGAFEALDIPLLQGRLFDQRDAPDAEHVAVVSRSFAESVWPGLDPIGRQVTGGGMDNFYQERRFARVIGVVGDVRYRDLGTEGGPTVYFPHSQRPFRIQYGASLVIEATQGDPAALFGSIRATLQRLDPDVPIAIESHQDLLLESLTARRFVMMLFGAFAGIALLLASVGIYGVVSYSVARRTREMGIRLALGADAGTVQKMVVRASMQMVVGGLIVGLVAAIGMTGLMQDLLFGVTPTDPMTLAAVVAILGLMGFLSSWIPARASTRVDPMVTMRAE
jgi:predicted permease